MIRLYLDEDVHKKVATALRLKGYDVISAHEVQKQSLSDYHQLEYAISQRGIILSKQMPLTETIKRLTKFLFSHSAEALRNNIFWI